MSSLEHNIAPLVLLLRGSFESVKDRRTFRTPSVQLNNHVAIGAKLSFSSPLLVDNVVNHHPFHLSNVKRGKFIPTINVVLSSFYKHISYNFIDT